MTLEQLECHLEELQHKNFETRGVLRKLIQQHANLGNLDKVTQYRAQFHRAGYDESFGMKASLFHLFIKKKQLEAALDIYNELKSKQTKFELDEFKIIDLVGLMVEQDQEGRALEILRQETKNRRVIGDAAIQRNCWQLLSCFENELEQEKVFNFLVEEGYCQPNNVILGPLVRIFLKR